MEPSMCKYLFPLMVLSLVLASCGEQPPDAADDAAADSIVAQADPLEVVTAANSATEAVTSVYYDYRSYGIGTAADMVPASQGSVSILETATPGVVCARVEMTLTVVDSLGAPFDITYIGTTDGDTVRLAESDTREFRVGAVADGGDDLMNPLMAGIMYEYIVAQPFGDEMAAESLAYEGTQEVSGTECAVILVRYREDTAARWFFSLETSLPLRVDRLLPDRSGAQVIELSNLSVDGEMDPASFGMECPEGYEQVSYSSFLPIGSMAPDWTLQTTAGEELSLADLRDGIVILDFWATWCGPCAMVMPALQQIHEEYADSGVTVVGVNTWETGDPAAFMTENGYTYTVVLAGDMVAEEYLVTGIPTFYVVGPDGTILGAFRGADPANEEALQRLIEENLSPR
jgi:thiol-disulfide isomerase/thioredoxin